MGLVALALVVAGCGEEIVVRVVTRVYPEGGVGRRVEITGLESDGSHPTTKDWMERNGRVVLARPQAWSQVEEEPGRVTVEGFFRSADDLPPTIAHRIEGGSLPERAGASLVVDDLVVLRHFVWRETLADPFDSASAAAAADSLAALAARAVREEIRRALGDRVDSARAESLVRDECRTLLIDLLPTIRAERRAGSAQAPSRRLWSNVLEQHGIPVASAARTLVSSEQLEAASSWLRGRVAASLSGPEMQVRPEDLVFWPEGENKEEELQAIVERVFGGEDELKSALDPRLAALTGYYGAADVPRFRFERRVTMPGWLLGTNGTPLRDGAFWIVRDEDLSGERVLEAASAELDDERLRALGARRDLTVGQIARLVDILVLRDPERELRKRLAAAVAGGRLNILRDAGGVSDSLEPLARELAGLLDPAVDLPPALP